MNRKLILGVLVILGIVAWMIFTEEDTSLENEKEVNRTAPPIKNMKPPSPKLEAHPLSEAEREKEIRRAVKRANVPILFWGKVTDQNGYALSNATVVYRIHQPRGMWDSHSITRTTSTDTKGEFQISGDKGSKLSIEAINKKGYTQAKGQKVSFTYIDNPEIYKPNESRPQIYTMIEVAEITELVKWERKLFLKWDGKPVRLNLKTGKVADQGEVRIIPKRGEINEKGEFDWLCRVEIVEGGILETTRSKIAVAPQSGYHRFWERRYFAGDKEWGSSTGISYLCFRQADNKYGYIRLTVSADPRRGNFSGRIKCHYNPSGSRILGEGIFRPHKK